MLFLQKTIVAKLAMCCPSRPSFLLLCVALLRSETIAETAIRGAQKDRRDRGSVKEVAGEQHLGSNNVTSSSRETKFGDSPRFEPRVVKSDTLMTSTH